MKRNINALLLVAALTGAAVLTGCSHGNRGLAQQSSESIDSKLVRNQTTREQVRADFGNPMASTRTASGGEVWMYNYSRVKAKAFIPFNYSMSGKSVGKALQVTFNNNGLVQDYSFTEMAP